jgi:Starch-binding associating with outer membrane
MMKNKFLSLLALCVIVIMSSCKDYLDVNIDPNQSTETSLPLQLSAAQMQTAVGLGQRIMPTCAIWCQYYTGGPGVTLGDPDKHLLSASEGNELFRNFYRSSSNLQYIIKDGKEPNYVAVAKIWKAYNFSVCADLFGDIPYTEALNGDITDGSVLHPKYDSAKDVVYPGIEADLLSAVALIDSNISRAHPDTDDLIYGGDMTKWKKFANSILLRMYVRTGNTAKAAAFTADDIITENADNCLMAFPGGPNQSNPFWNAARSTALGNYYVATTTTIDHLASTSDPRIDFFFDKSNTGQHTALAPGNVQAVAPNASFSTPSGAKLPAGGLIYSATAPVILFSAWEGHLLLAEVASRGGVAADAQAGFEAAVGANFEFLGVGSDSAYLASIGSIGSGNAALKAIAIQKWTCMNGLQPVESWIETRRSDSGSNPIFSSTGGIFKSPIQNALPGGAFPSILPYPESEESLNRSFPGQHPLTAKVFWDN